MSYVGAAMLNVVSILNLRSTFGNVNTTFPSPLPLVDLKEPVPSSVSFTFMLNTPFKFLSSVRSTLTSYEASSFDPTYSLLLEVAFFGVSRMTKVHLLWE